MARVQTNHALASRIAFDIEEPPRPATNGRDPGTGTCMLCDAENDEHHTDDCPWQLIGEVGVLMNVEKTYHGASVFAGIGNPRQHVAHSVDTFITMVPNKPMQTGEVAAVDGKSIGIVTDVHIDGTVEVQLTGSAIAAPVDTGKARNDWSPLQPEILHGGGSVYTPVAGEVEVMTENGQRVIMQAVAGGVLPIRATAARYINHTKDVGDFVYINGYDEDGVSDQQRYAETCKECKGTGEYESPLTGKRSPCSMGCKR